MGKTTARSKDISQIYGETFMNKLLGGIRQKKYRGKDTAVNEDDKLKQHLTSLLIGGKPTLDLHVPEEEEVDGFSKQRKIPEEEVQLIEDFLDKFVFISETTTSKEQIDLNLALKSLPLKVDDWNIYRIDLINFNLIQKSLIAFQNDD